MENHSKRRPHHRVSRVGTCSNKLNDLILHSNADPLHLDQLRQRLRATQMGSPSPNVRTRLGTADGGGSRMVTPGLAVTGREARPKSTAGRMLGTNAGATYSVKRLGGVTASWDYDNREAEAGTSGVRKGRPALQNKSHGLHLGSGGDGGLWMEAEGRSLNAWRKQMAVDIVKRQADKSIPNFPAGQEELVFIAGANTHQSIHLLEGKAKIR